MDDAVAVEIGDCRDDLESDGFDFLSSEVAVIASGVRNRGQQAHGLTLHRVAVYALSGLEGFYRSAH